MSRQSADDHVIDIDMLLREHPQYRRDHVFHETLQGEDMILCPYIMKNTTTQATHAVVRYGGSVRGHPSLGNQSFGGF
ncbi:unnamed protein product [Chrysoparadoxa australica]